MRVILFIEKSGNCKLLQGDQAGPSLSEEGGVGAWRAKRQRGRDGSVVMFSSTPLLLEGMASGMYVQVKIYQTAHLNMYNLL